jgi:hypothetical protein
MKQTFKEHALSCRFQPQDSTPRGTGLQLALLRSYAVTQLQEAPDKASDGALVSRTRAGPVGLKALYPGRGTPCLSGEAVDECRAGPARAAPTLDAPGPCRERLTFNGKVGR